MTTSPNHQNQRVIVLGAGYGGLIAALRLAPHARVTLIDPSDHFTERVRQHELLARAPRPPHPLTTMLRGTGVRHLARRATSIDPTARRVTTDDGQSLPYDRLVYALGSRTGRTPGAAPEQTAPEQTAAERVYTAESADSLRTRLRSARPGTLAVVGAGLTGTEVAAELAETHPDWKISLLSTGEVAAGHSAKGRAHVRTVLTARGVRIEEGRKVGSPEEVDADALFWAASMTPNTALADTAGLRLDPITARIEVDETLRSVSYPEIYAVGDAAAAHSAASGPLRMGCAAALPTGFHAAGAIIAESLGRRPEPLRFGYVTQCVSLGRHDGLIQFVHPDDTPRDRVLTGRTAALVKEQVVRATVGILRLARSSPRALPLVPGLG
ncbi:dehydrogenase [Streptomyces inusitatus]|uniref:Dehydrogenase n=1 Tax=Streptomyces inusitatus TaxID=68221 RepID=A0A918PJ64_9ACTN|nr:FAD-dependent oxidoreductase [Streptomyces inusitatus]GGZ12201.1 dehydrogenase [Streptomyces inusitatus]